MNTNLFRARLDAAFLVPFLTVGWSLLYRADEPVSLEGLMYDTVDGDEEWRRVDRLSAGYLYHQVVTSEVPLLVFKWPGAVGCVYGSLYLAEFGLRKTFVVARSRVGPNIVLAAYRGLEGPAMIPVCVESMLSHGAEWYPQELFDELPARTINRRPDLLAKETLLAGYCGFAERVLGESERLLVEAYFESTYAEEPLAAPAQTAG